MLGSVLKKALGVFSTILMGAPALLAQDTIVVRADNPPVWGKNLQLVEEIRIGQLDGPEEYLFGSVDGIAVDRDGILYVADGQEPIIRRYDRDGRFLGNIGGNGGGPGEFFRIRGIAVLSTGDLAVWDPRNLRVSIFHPSGDFARSVRVTTSLNTANPFQVDTAGHFYVKASIFSRPPPSNEIPTSCWLHVSPDGEILDSIPIPPKHPGVDSFVLATPFGYQGPFTEETGSALSPLGYLVVGLNTDYSLSRSLPDGRVLRIERGYSPTPVSSDEKAQWEAWSDWFESRPVPEGMVSESRANYPPIPDQKPAYRGFWADQEGRIWVHRYVEAEFHARTPEQVASRKERPRPYFEWREPPVWDVIDPRGTYLGTIRTPENGWIGAATGEFLWVVERGELDVESVVRYRIEAR